MGLPLVCYNFQDNFSVFLFTIMSLIAAVEPQVLQGIIFQEKGILTRRLSCTIHPLKGNISLVF